MCFEGAHLQVRRHKSFIFVIPNRLRPVRDLLFQFLSKLFTRRGSSPIL